MKFFIRKYVFSPTKRIFLASIISLFLVFLILAIHLSVLVNSVENLRLESIVSALMNTSKVVYKEYGDTSEQAKGVKSWLSKTEEESPSGFDLFAEIEKKEKETKARESEKENKFEQFSYVLSEVLDRFGNPKDENSLISNNLCGVEVIKGNSLVADSDLNKLSSGSISINNLFRIKKESTENNFVVEEKTREFFLGYDRVIKAYTFKDDDLTVGVAYIEKPIQIPVVSIAIFAALSLILALPFLLVNFIPNNFKIYAGLILFILITILLVLLYSSYIESIVKENLQITKDISTFIYDKLNEKGLSVDKTKFFEELSTPVGDIKPVKLIPNDEGVEIDVSSLEEYANIFRNVFILIYLPFALIFILSFYYFAKGGLEIWLNAFYNYSLFYIFILIALLLVIILIGVPFFFTIVLSFTSLSRYLSDLNLARQFVGFLNYGDILNINHILAKIGFENAQKAIEQSPFFVRNFGSFYDVLVNTFLYTFFSVLIQLVLGITFAVILNDNKVKLRGVYQVLLILPWVIPTYISALLWREALGQYGVFKQLFDAIGLEGFNIYANSTVYFFSICFISAWYAFPFIMIVTLSGLQGISDSVKDAALIDGANWFTRLFAIYLPLIRPTLLPSVLLSSIWTFNNFNIVYLYTGGNDAYDILITRIYDFVSRPDLRVFTYGYASAYSVLVFLILLIYILSFAKLTKLTERSY
ncbi:MAG: carbohydrate ABC transporter permease [Brevinematia bacterium]